MNPPPASLARFSDDLEDLLLRFEDAWNSGEPTDLQAFCPPQPEPAFLKELVRIDIARRKSKRLPIDIDRYVAIFPALSGTEESIRDLASDTAFSSRAHANLAIRGLPGYEILSELGRGGMGVVYKARQISINRLVALKMIRSGEIASAEELARFRGEAEAVAGLTHRHIVQLFEFGTHEGLPYFTLEFMPGGSLADRVKDEPLSAREAAELLEGLALGVAEAHARNIIHRDLKPGNVLLAADGTAKIADFGLAKHTDPASLERTDVSLTRTGAIVGTPQYMSPEQARGDKTIDSATDIWALGAILYRVLTGRPPFLGATALETIQQVTDAEPIALRSLIATIPRDLETICLKCLQKESARRYASAKELATDLRRYLNGQPILARPVSALERGMKWARRRPAAATALGLLVCLVIGLGIGLWMVNRERKRTAGERDNKEIALQAEKKAHEAALMSRAVAMNATRKLTDDVVQRLLGRGDARLSEDDRRFLREVQRHFEVIANLPGDDFEQRLIRAEGKYRVGQVCSKLGNIADAEAAYRQSADMYRQLVDEFPKHRGYREGLAGAYGNLAQVLHLTGRFQEAESLFRAELAIKTQLAADFHEDPELRLSLSRTHNTMANLFQSRGRIREAESSYSKALAVQNQLTTEFPERAEFRKELGLTYYNLSVLLHNDNRLSEAETTIGHALQHQNRLLQDSPKSFEFRRDVAGTHHMMGLLLMVRMRPKDAETPIGNALAVRKELVGEFPGHLELRLELGLSYSMMAQVLSHTNRPKQAEAASDEAIKIQKQLVAEFPNVPDYRNDLAGALVNRAGLARSQGDHTQAKKWLDEAQPHHLAALKANPGHPSYRQFYRNNLTLMTLNCAAMGDRVTAVASAAKVRDLGWDPSEDAYYAAMLLAECVEISERDKKVSATERAKQMQLFGDQAIAMLQHAVAKGFRDADKLQKDPYLAAVRKREDFQKLVQQLKKK